MVDIHIRLTTVTKMWRELRGKSRTTTATRDSAARMTTILEVSVAGRTRTRARNRRPTAASLCAHMRARRSVG